MSLKSANRHSSRTSRPVDNPIFVIGSARSGTCFLGGVLKRHPDIHCLIERPDVFQFASYLALHPSVKAAQPRQVRDQLLQLYSEAWKLSRWSCRKCSEVCKTAGDVSRLPWGTCHKGRSVKRYADKSHQHVLNVSTLLHAFPEAQFVHLVRDGRDVVASMLRHSGVVSWFAEEYINASSEWPQPWFGVKTAEQYQEWSQWSLAKKCALRWVSWVRAGLDASKNLHGEQWLDIRYEKLVTRPQEQARELFTFLNLDMVEGAVAHAHASSVGSWSARLSKEELGDAMSIMGKTLEEAGYLV